MAAAPLIAAIMPSTAAITDGFDQMDEVSGVTVVTGTVVAAVVGLPRGASYPNAVTFSAPTTEMVVS